MKRVDHSTAAVDFFGPGKPGYQGKEVASQRPGTVVTPEALNHMQEEIAAPIEAMGFTLDGDTYNQLYASLKAMFGRMALQNHVARTPAASYSGAIQGLAYGASLSKYVLVGGSAGTVQYSTDGVTWTATTAGGSFTGIFMDVCFGNGVFVACGESGEINTSGDALTWTHRTPAGSYSDYFNAGTWTGSQFVLVGDSAAIQTSPTGTTWTARTKAGAYASSFWDVASSDTLTVIVGNTGEIQTSPDGVTWTKRTAGSSYAGNLLSVCYGNGRFVAVGSSSASQVSTDGITWTKGTTSGASTLQGVHYWAEAGFFVGVGVNGTTQVSYDGLTWLDVTRPVPTASLGAMCTGARTLLFGGATGVIRQSLVMPTI